MATDYKKDPNYVGYLENIVLALNLQIAQTQKGGEKFKIKGELLFSQSNLDMLPNDDFIYGYLYGFVDISFQISEKYKDDRKAWLAAVAIIFSEFYGSKLSGEVLKNCKVLLNTNEKFKKGCQLGGNEAKIFYHNGKPVVGLISYIRKNFEK